MWTELENLDSFFTKDMRRTIVHGVQRPARHVHNFSVTDTEVSTDIVNDQVESVPQLYDKKVSIILNRSLARTPSTTSFKTSLADSFQNNGASTAPYPPGTSLKREIDFNRIGPTTSASVSEDSVDLSTGTALSDDDDDSNTKNHSSIKFPYVGSQHVGKATSTLPRVSAQPSQESSFRLESLLRGNIRKGKKKEEKKEEKTSRSKSRGSGVRPNFSSKQRSGGGGLSNPSSSHSLASFNEQSQSPTNRKGRELESSKNFQFPPAR
jgi:hypothetical protein